MNYHIVTNVWIVNCDQQCAFKANEMVCLAIVFHGGPPSKYWFSLASEIWQHQTASYCSTSQDILTICFYNFPVTLISYLSSIMDIKIVSILFPGGLDLHWILARLRGSVSFNSIHWLRNNSLWTMAEALQYRMKMDMQNGDGNKYNPEIIMTLYTLANS